MRVPRHSARAWRRSRLRIWKKRDSFSKYNFCLPMFSLLEAEETVRREAQWVDFPEWLWSWEDRAPLIEQRWAWTGLVPSLSSAPPSAPRPCACHSMIHTHWFLTGPFSLSPLSLYTHTHFTVLYLWTPSLTSFILPATWCSCVLSTHLPKHTVYPNIIKPPPLFTQM